MVSSHHAGSPGVYVSENFDGNRPALGTLNPPSGLKAKACNQRGGDRDDTSMITACPEL